MELVQGVRLGDRFKVLGCLGTSTLGPLFLAADGFRDDAQVTLRLVPRSASLDPVSARRLVHVHSEISHPHLGETLDLFEGDDGAIGIVSEYIDGENLEERLLVGRITLEDTVSILKQLASAINALHERELVHGAIKPANVVMTADGSIKLTDALTVALRTDGGAPRTRNRGAQGSAEDIRALGMLGNLLVSELDRRVEPDGRADSSEIRKHLRSILDRAASKSAQIGYGSAFDLYLDLEWLEEELHSKSRLASLAFVSCFTIFELGLLAIFLSFAT